MAALQEPLLLQQSDCDESDDGSDVGGGAARALRPSEPLNGVLSELKRRAASGSKESLDYDTDYDQRRRWSWGFERHCWGYSGSTLAVWGLAVVLGATMGLIAFALALAIQEFEIWKLGWVERLLNPCTEPGACDGIDEAGRRAELRPGLALAAFCGGNLLLVLLGTLPTVLLAPEAAGSGIPEVMGYLNGVHLRDFLRLRTLVVKLLGSFAAVTSGLAVGVLAPLVHTGAIVGSGLTRGHKVWRCGGRRCCACRAPLIERFHNDADRRDVISMGAAVGFAAAFGAPVGGVLFALEEASIWDSKLMWRTLTATTLACFVLALCERYLAPLLVDIPQSCVAGPNATSVELFQPGLLTFQTTASFEAPWENAICVLIGVAGGMLGAMFNRTHAVISRLRRRHLHGRRVRMIGEMLLLSLATSGIIFALALYGTCQPVANTAPQRELLQPCNTSEEPFRLQWAAASGRPLCRDDEYNDMATALLVGQRRVIISMMEDPRRYAPLTLLAVGVAFFVLMTLTVGSSIPAGTYVPNILCGACFGSLVGVAMEDAAEHFADVTLNAAPYALQGSVALLGGVQRSSLSLVVIIIEGTGAVRQLLPIILTTVVAKWIGDLFSTGLNQTTLQIKEIPVITTSWDSRKHRAKCARDVMTGDDIVCLLEEEPSAEDCLRKLSSNSHNGFPVVRPTADGRKLFVGLILRRQVFSLVAERHFVEKDGAVLRRSVADAQDRAAVDEAGADAEDPAAGATLLADEGLRAALETAAGQRLSVGGSGTHRSNIPRLIERMRPQPTGADRGLASTLDLTAAMNRSPFTVDANCPLTRVWRLFRTMGLRHLVVLDEEHCVVGLITRADLLAASGGGGHKSPT